MSYCHIHKQQLTRTWGSILSNNTADIVEMTVNRVLMLCLLYEILLLHASVLDLLTVVCSERKLMFCTHSGV